MPHTKGPWRAQSTPLFDGQVAISDSNQSHLASAYSGLHDAKANARLIAAAPCLLAALKECAKQLRLTGNPGHAAVAENAIAKAEGRG